MPDLAARHILRTSGWLANEPEWLADALLACARIMSWNAGKLIQMAGDEPGGIYGIVDGGVGVLVPAGGSEMLYCHVLRTGSWFSAGPILAKGPRSLLFRTVETCRTAYVTPADLHAIGARHPELYRRLGALSEDSFHNVAFRAVGDLLIPSSERRIAAVLARIAGAGQGSAEVPPAPIRLSQSIIGQMSNCSRDRVNQALGRFAKAGWITSRYRAIVVNDFAALESFAEDAHRD